jgi:hypothetical protein
MRLILLMACFLTYAASAGAGDDVDAAQTIIRSQADELHPVPKTPS